MFAPSRIARRYGMICCFIATFGCPIVRGQEGTAGRRQFVQGLLKSFIDSQLTIEPEATAGRPVQPNPAVGRRLPASQLEQSSQLLTQAADEMSQLVGAMQEEIYRGVPGVRQLLSLAMNVNADAAVLSRRLSRVNEVEALRVPLSQLDQDWHTLEYRLSQIPNLRRNTLARIERIQQLESQLTSMFGLGKQIDLSAIANQALQMNNALRNLLEDIRYEITDTNTANRLLQDGRDTYDQLQRLLQLARNESSSYETIKNSYDQVESEWARYERRLRAVDNRFVQRQMQRVNDHARTLRELLYLTNDGLNRELLSHNAGLLQKDIDQLLSHVTLGMLSKLPAANWNAIDAASDLETSCNDLVDVIQAGDEVDVLHDVYASVHDEWERLSLALQGVDGQQARQSLRDVDRSLKEVQSQLGVRLDFDRREATNLATTIVGQARHLQEDLRDFFSRPNRYPREFQSESLRATQRFYAAATRLHDELVHGDSLRQLKATGKGMADAYESLVQYIPRFSSSEQMHLNRVRRQLTPQVVRMQTLVSL